jgi:hypothetical protein
MCNQQVKRVTFFCVFAAIIFDDKMREKNKTDSATRY